MNDSLDSSNILDKQQPLNPNGSVQLNKKLQTQHINLAPDDYSCQGSVIRTVANLVAEFLSPRFILGTVRVLKAITLAFLILTVIADLMYMVFLEILADKEVRVLAGGTRDTIVRIYGLILSVIALAIERDVRTIVKKFSGLRGFIARGCLLFFIATITSAHPMKAQNYAKNNDDAYGGDDNVYGGGDDAAAAYQKSPEIPASSIGFQIVTSLVLGVCAICYIICGLLCFDRFKTAAFVSSNDYRKSTAVADPSIVAEFN